MNAIPHSIAEKLPVRRNRKEEKIHVRLERTLADRLRLAADKSDISASDKVRRILDAALPPTA